MSLMRLKNNTVKTQNKENRKKTTPNSGLAKVAGVVVY